MCAEKKTQVDETAGPQEIQFHFIKANGYRNVRVDGIFGGITPNGKIQMDFFSERNPIPRSITHPISPDGKMENELTSERVSKEGIIREVEFSSVIDINLAKSIVRWFEEKIKQIEAVQAEINERENDD